MADKDKDRSDDTIGDDEKVTGEVGSEGGGFGNVQLEREDGPMRGSNVTSTVDSKDDGRLVEHRHDETGEGRRNP